MVDKAGGEEREEIAKQLSGNCFQFSPLHIKLILMSRRGVELGDGVVEYVPSLTRARTR